MHCFPSLQAQAPAFNSLKSQSMCPRQRTNEKPATAENEKASHETTPLQCRARAARKIQGNDLSRLCKQDQCDSMTRPGLQYRGNCVGFGVWSTRHQVGKKKTTRSSTKKATATHSTSEQQNTPEKARRAGFRDQSTLEYLH